MDKYLKSYIDNNIIREHAFKYKGQYHLQVFDLDQEEQETLLDIMFQHDYGIKDIVLDRMQELINERLPLVESQDNYENGLKPILDNLTGEVTWTRRVA